MKNQSRRILRFAALLLATLIVLLYASAANAQKFTDWGPPVNLGPVINSAFDDQHPALSPNGLSLYFISNRPGGYGDLDIYVSQRASADDPWGAPQNLGSIVNSAFIEFAPTITPDGHWLYFGSNRPGGCGGQDIYRSYRDNTDDDFAWGTPQNLGCLINSPQDDDGPTFFQDEDTGLTTLYFTSFNRPGGLGDWDIYASLMDENGNFRRAALVAELSSSSRDTRSALRSDGLEMIFISTRPGGFGGHDLWVSTRETTRDAWSKPVNLGPIVNSAADDSAPAISADGTVLIFWSNRPGGFGGKDLYMSTRMQLPDGGDDAAR